MDLPKAPTQKELEDSAYYEPSFNVGQRVVWLVGIKHTPGTIVTVSAIRRKGPRWFLETNGDGTVFPARVLPIFEEHGDAAAYEKMKKITE